MRLDSTKSSERSLKPVVNEFEAEAIAEVEDCTFGGCKVGFD